MSNLSDIMNNIQEVKQKLENMSKEIENISTSNDVILSPASYISKDKSETHINVCLQLEYNEKKQTIILPNTLLPVDLFDLIERLPTKQEKIIFLQKCAGKFGSLLFAKHKDSVSEEDINELYKEFYCDTKMYSHDMSKMTAYIKTLNIKDFDETKNKIFSSGCIARGDQVLYNLTPCGHHTNITQYIQKKMPRNKYINVYISLE